MMVPDLTPPDYSTAMLVMAAVTLSFLWWGATRRPPGLPPGPGYALPLLGHLLVMRRDPRQTFRKWRQTYGDVFSIYMGPNLLVVLNGYDVIKETFVKMADFFSDRPSHDFLSEKVWENAGVLFTSGVTWKEQRKSALEILRHLGMGKNSLAEKIQEEISYYIQAIEDRQGTAEELATLTEHSVSNNICSIVFGQRFQYDDPEFQRYLHALDKFFRALNLTGAVNFVPKPELWPGDVFNAKQILQQKGEVENKFLRQQVAAHLKSHTDDHEEDFIHLYIDQMKKRQAAGSESTLSETHLLKITLDLFLAGTETTTTAIGWALLFFLHHPEVQDKCYQEICKVVGTSRLPSMADKPEMTYMEATIMEIMRKGEIAPLTAFHYCKADVKFRSYVIPRDTVVVANLSSIMTDPALWGDPDVFRPERFIGPDGNLLKREEFIPFGIGRRVCLGEALGRMELFLYLTTLVQRFRFLPEDPENLPPLEGSFGATNMAKPYKIRAVLRD